MELSTDLPKSRSFWKVAEYLLGLTALACIFSFIYLNMNLEIRDPDLWLHLKTGEYIIQHQAIPQADIFSHTLSSKPWIDHSWLSQVIYYSVFHFLGENKLILLSALLVLFAFIFLFFTTYRSKENIVPASALLFLAALASQQRFNIRPENFSILFFSLFLFLIIKFPRRRFTPFILAIIQALWVNCHGFYILGPLLLVVFLATAKDSRKHLFFALLLTGLACLINPYGIKGMLYPLRIGSTTLGESGIYYKYIQELRPTWHYFDAYSSYFLLAALSLAALLINFKKINFTYLALWLILLGFSLGINRNIIFFNFIAFIAAVESLSTNGPKAAVSRGLYILKYLILILIIGWILKTDRFILANRYYVFDENKFKSSLLGIAESQFPKKAADFILKNDLPENIFNFFNHGSYFIYRLSPRKKVFIDGRTEMYGGEFFKNYQQFLSGESYTVKNTLAKYHINTAALSSIDLNFEGLFKYFSADPGWALVYLEADGVIFVRDSAVDQALLGRIKINKENLQILKADFIKLGLKNVFPEPYLKRAWAMHYLGFEQQALGQAKEALRILPGCGSAYNIIGEIFVKRRMYGHAFEAFRSANIYCPNDRETMVNLGELYFHSGNIKLAKKMFSRLVKMYPDFTKGRGLLSQTSK